MDTKSAHPLIGLRVVSRAPGSGVHIGTLVGTDHGHELKDAQRIWSWEGALDTAMLAATGPSSARVSPVVTGISVISDGRELYPMSEVSEANFIKIGVWNA